MDTDKLAAIAYERYAAVLAAEGQYVPPWINLVWLDQSAWIAAVEAIANEMVWEAAL